MNGGGGLRPGEMANDKINILVTFNKNYIKPFQVMLKSLAINNPLEVFHIWLLHSAIPQEDLLLLSEYCGAHRMALTPIQVDHAIFENAPVSKQYPQEMYYRLMAPLLLPDVLDRVLYLDPDILVINPVRSLWEKQLGECAFAAASRSVIGEVINVVNQVRLGNDREYFNTGVLLMDLEKARLIVKAEDLFTCVREQGQQLLLPDQDVFNLLYGAYTLQEDDTVWNYDARYFSAYEINSKGQYDLDWVMKNTVFLHFCGKQKPWKAKYSSRFASLYKHYMNLAGCNRPQ